MKHLLNDKVEVKVELKDQSFKKDIFYIITETELFLTLSRSKKKKTKYQGISYRKTKIKSITLIEREEHWFLLKRFIKQ